MKLRDKQEKLEKMLLYQKFAGSPFQQARTYVKAAFSVIGSLLFFEDDFLGSADRLERSGTKTGVNSRLTFETVIKDRGSLVAEFGTAGFEPLGLHKLMYHARVNDLFSLVLVPVGAQCCNFRMNSSSSHVTQNNCIYFIHQFVNSLNYSAPHNHHYSQIWFRGTMMIFKQVDPQYFAKFMTLPLV
jgi:hypothetical protein